MGITGFLPSMFAGLARIQKQNKKLEDERQKDYRSSYEIRTKSFIENQPCRSCGKNLRFNQNLFIGECICGAEFSYEYLKFNPSRKDIFINLKIN